MEAMIREQLAILLSRKLSGEATTQELRELEEWIRTHPQDQFFIEIFDLYWKNYHPNTLVKQQADQHFEHILQRAVEDEKASIASDKGAFIKLNWMKISAAAATVVLILSVIFLVNNKHKRPVQQPNEIMAVRGAKSQMILPDGSKVWLNSDSKMHLNEAFNDTTREVYLQGEAYFDVVKNAKRPFIVHTSAIDIRVLGTAFNVKAYDNEGTIEATLIRGLIEVKNKLRPTAPNIILRPNEKLVFSKEVLAEAVSTQNANNSLNTNSLPSFSVKTLPLHGPESTFVETSWIHNRLLFEGDTFKELAVKMERWYNVHITFRNDAIANYRLRGSFEEENIEEALKALQLIAPFTYKIDGNEIEILNK